MRPYLLCAVMLTTAACAADPAATPVGTAPTVTVAVAPVTADGAGAGGVSTLEIPRDTAQVGVRLRGELGDLDGLIAEIAPAAAPDEIRRWRVDPAPAAADGATAMVTLPPHAIPDGAYVITVWEGDARVVARYTFQARKAP